MINHWILVIPMEFLHFQNKAHLFQQDWDHLGCLLCQLGDPPDQSDCSQRHGWCRHQIRGPAPEINWYQLWIGEKSSKCYAQTLNIELPNCGIAKHISKKHIPLVVFCFRGQFDLFPSGSCHILPYLATFHHLPSANRLFGTKIETKDQHPKGSEIMEQTWAEPRVAACPRAPGSGILWSKDFLAKLQPQGRPRKP